MKAERAAEHVMWEAEGRILGGRCDEYSKRMEEEQEEIALEMNLCIFLITDFSELE